MKKVTVILLVSMLALSGCSSKSAVDSEANGRTEVKTEFQAAKPGTVPQLSEQQKTQVDAKVSSAIKNIDNALGSLQDANDIDLSSLDQK